MKILIGDCRETLRTLRPGSVHCVVTSPPYFGLRCYGHTGQIGLEETPDRYVAEMVAVFREVRRVLRDDGTVWLNLGDSYATRSGPDFKPKDLIGIPWRVAFALQADGWYLRQDVVWHKPNAMPSSVKDRCTRAHEYIFTLTKSARYYYDHEAIKTPPSEALLRQVAEGYKGSDTKDYGAGGAQSASGTKTRIIEQARKKIDKQSGHGRQHAGFNGRWNATDPETRAALGANKRSVWTVTTKPFKGAHFATFPPDLIEPCILAGCPPGGVVLDPFGGSGTTAGVAAKHHRRSILCELNPDYVEMIRARVQAIAPDWEDLI